MGLERTPKVTFTPNERRSRISGGSPGRGESPGENRTRESVPSFALHLEPAPQEADTQLYAAFVVLITTAPML